MAHRRWSFGLIIVGLLGIVAYVWIVHKPYRSGAFIQDSARDSALESMVDSGYFSIPNHTPSAHASTIIALDHAHIAPSLRDSYAFMALFFAGSREGASDVGIYQSFFTYARVDSSVSVESSWSEPREILSPGLLSQLSGKFIAKLGNPVSFVDSRGRVHLFVVGVSLGGWATSRVYWLMFDDNLAHLHFKQELDLSPFANLSSLVRNPAVMLEDGGFILPVYHELARKYPLLLRFTSNLSLESTIKPLSNIGAKSLSKLQPSFVALDSSRALGVYRNYTPSPMQVSLCQWREQLFCQNPKPSNLINYNSSSVLFTAEGLVFLLHNSPPTPYTLSAVGTESTSLDSALSHAREQLHIFVLASLEKDRVEFVPVCLLDSVENGEVSYPSVAKLGHKAHITYTYKRSFIRTALLDLHTLAQKAQISLANPNETRLEACND